MEPITLCGAVILAFGLWVEIEPMVRLVIKTVRNSRFLAVVPRQSTRRPVYVKKYAW